MRLERLRQGPVELWITRGRYPVQICLFCWVEFGFDGERLMVGETVGEKVELCK